ncbi:MAG: hypothetical protein HY900_18370 [Deltaproteobacteria bacterium]|nr:hypothetical protein [Deltaproteobacteria bacterium]
MRSEGGGADRGSRPPRLFAVFALLALLLGLAMGGSGAEAPPAGHVRDLKPLVSLPSTSGVPVGSAALWLGGAAVAAVASWLAARRRRSARRTASGPASAALSVLSTLSSRADLPDRSFYRELSSALSDYLTRRFSVDLSTRSLDEVLLLIEELPVAAEPRMQLKALLPSIESARYGGIELGAARRDADLGSAVSFIRSICGEPPRAAR